MLLQTTSLLLSVCFGFFSGPGATSVIEPPSSLVNEKFISLLLEAVSYNKLATTTYSRTCTPVKEGGQVCRFKHGLNTYTCYQSSTNNFLTSFAVVTSDPILAPVLRIGASKQLVVKQLGLAKSLDSLKVTDMEGGSVVTLIFQHDNLIKVSYYAVVD